MWKAVLGGTVLSTGGLQVKRRTVGNVATPTKKGKHGTLYLYEIKYDIDPGVPHSWFTYAYNEEHAIEKWDESNVDEGFRFMSVGRAKIRIDK
jgi:hypothetical protein